MIEEVRKVSLILSSRRKLAMQAVATPLLTCLAKGNKRNRLDLVSL